MSNIDFPHYNTILKSVWPDDTTIIFKPCALQMPYDKESGWPLDLPPFPDFNTLKDNFLILIHFQDSLTHRRGQCLEIKKLETLYSGIKHHVVVITEDIELYQEYIGDINIVWFPTFVYELLGEIKKTYSQWEHYLHTKPTKKWQCLNGIPRKVRTLVAYYLNDNFTDGILSLSDEIPLDKYDYESSYKGCDNNVNFLNLDWVYKNCGINIVTETVYDYVPGIITEKSLFAFLAGQVPIVIAHCGAVKNFRDFGFDMFEDIVDTSYDSLPNRFRWRQAIDLNADLIKQGIDREKLKERLLYNRNHALNVWPKQLIEIYENQIHEIDGRR